MNIPDPGIVYMSINVGVNNKCWYLLHTTTLRGHKNKYIIKQKKKQTNKQP